MRLQRKHRPPAEGMKRYKGHVSVGLVGCRVEFEFDIEEDASEQDIEDMARDAMFEHIEWGFDPIDATNK